MSSTHSQAQLLSFSSRSSPSNSEDNVKHPQQPPELELAAGASASARRPRGRPPGSKNKPKPPVIINRDPNMTAMMRPLLLEIPSAADVLDTISDFAHRRGVSVSVLSATGALSHLCLRHPNVPTSIVNLTGHLEILTLSGTFLPTKVIGAAFTASVVGSQGQVAGGMVAGLVTAAIPVTVTAAVFSGLEIYRFPNLTHDHQNVEQGDEATSSTRQPERGSGSGSGYGVGNASEMIPWNLSSVVPRAPPPHLQRQQGRHY